MDGHIAAPGSDGSTHFDAWSHVRVNGTHRAMVIKYPEAGLLQGAEAYLRDIVQRRRAKPKIVEELRAVLSM